MKEKKKYIKPTSELIKVDIEDLMGITRNSLPLNNNASNLLHDKNTQVTAPQGDNWNSAPKTFGDYGVTPSGDIDFGSKVNPWNSWDE